MIGSIRRTAYAFGAALLALVLVLHAAGRVFARRDTIRQQRRQIEAHETRERIEDEISRDDDLAGRARRSGLVR